MEAFSEHGRTFLHVSFEAMLRLLMNMVKYALRRRCNGAEICDVSAALGSCCQGSNVYEVR
jgi:hypothetical protein